MSSTWRRRSSAAGNRAVHESKPPTQLDAVEVVSALFQFCFWFALTYGRATKPDPAVSFDPQAADAVAGARRRPSPSARSSRSGSSARPRRQSWPVSASRADAHQSSSSRLSGGADRPRSPRRRRRPRRRRPSHDYSEAETRHFIDLLLAEAAGRSTQSATASSRSRACPTARHGYVDYVLWGDDGMPLALVEAKRTRRDARVGQQQAKLYADCLEQQFGQRPVIFYTNGYEHWLWDDTQLPAAAGAGLLQEGRAGAADPAARPRRKPLADARDQRRRSSSATTRRGRSAAIAEALRDATTQRKALLVMATGAGKTRTVIALVDLLMRCQLGQARAVPRRPRGAGEPGGQRLQGAPARLGAGEPRDREGTRRAGSTSRPTRR